MNLLSAIFVIIIVAFGCTSTGNQETNSSQTDERESPDASSEDTSSADKSADTIEDTGADTEVRNTDIADTENEDSEATDTGPVHLDTEDTETEDGSVEEEVVFHITAMLASDIVYESPGTVGIVTWSVTGATVDRAVIRFGLTTSYDMTAPVDLEASSYRTLLLGMKSSSMYHFQIVVESGGRVFESEDQLIETGPPSNLVTLQATIENTSLHERGYILSTQLQNTSPNATGSMAFILDADGDLVWWYESLVGQTSRAHMAYNGKSIWLIPDRGSLGSAAIERVSLDTLESTVYDAGASHDAIPAGEEMLAYIEYGEGDCGSIFELFENGDTNEIFESSDYLPGLVPNECHTNSIRYYESEGLYSVSDYAQDIFVINQLGELQWRLTDFISNDAWGGIQHGHQLFADSILLFANKGGEGGRAAIIEFALPSGEEIFRYDPGLTSGYYGDVQRLPGGNTLATFSVSGIIHEVTPAGEPVMTVQGSSLGYAMWYPSMYVE